MKNIKFKYKNYLFIITLSILGILFGIFLFFGQACSPIESTSNDSVQDQGAETPTLTPSPTSTSSITPTPTLPPGEFSCIDDELDLDIYLSQQFKIIAYYGLFLGRIPEKEGFEYWDKTFSTFVPFLTADTAMLDFTRKYYSPFFQNFESNNSDQDLINFISSVYKFNFGTDPDQGGLTYWKNDYRNANRSPLSSMLPIIYEAFMRTRCSTQTDLQIKRTITIRHLALINALNLGDYFRKKQVPAATLALETTYSKLQKWYRDVITETSAALTSVGTSEEMKTVAAAKFQLYKSQINNWCNTNCTR